MFNPSYSFYKLFPGIYAVAFSDPIELSKTFWRAQEFYESASDEFRGQKFTFDSYSKWYADTQSVTKTFSYYEDWIGFNLPSDSIHLCYEINDERLDADEAFLKIMKTCQEQSQIDGLEKYYLLGVSVGDLKTLDHEIAHGLFFTNETYKNEMNQALQNTPESLRQLMKKTILDYGYNEFVVDDESQAYWATGLGARMLELELSIPCFHFNHIFKKYIFNWTLPKPLFHV